MALTTMPTINYSGVESLSRIAQFTEKMLTAGLDRRVAEGFAYYYAQLEAGATGYIAGDSAQPVSDLPTYSRLTDRHAVRGIACLDRLVVLKLNGGLGTSMGMKAPKSLVEVKQGLSFLDITVGQIRRLRQNYGVRAPLVLMNSFRTEAATHQALASLDDFGQDVPSGFTQNMFPKVWKSDLSPVDWPADRAHEWNPPGHGDLYAAIVTSGMLEKLLSAGYEYAFVSNIDNLGAIFDPAILGYLASEEIPFLMEVADRTHADRKGGHLAQRADGRLILRESAQCPPEEAETFQDISLYRYFNTNNLWIHLPTLARISRERSGVLGLSLIRNEKPVDPTQPDSPRAYQLETAMGSAIEVFDGAQALAAPRSRFLPVKRNTDLLALMSDAYVMSDEHTIALSPSRHSEPLITLDPRFYHLIDDLKLRFPHGAPSLIGCSSLSITGDVRFGRDVVLRGDVVIENRGDEPLQIADGSALCG